MILIKKMIHITLINYFETSYYNKIDLKTEMYHFEISFRYFLSKKYSTSFVDNGFVKKYFT